MTHHKFGIVINCIDGRVQEAVPQWLKERFNLDYIDVITEPGVDGLLASEETDVIEQLKAKVQRSIKAHSSNVLAIVGHHDCLANKASKERHLEQIKQAMEIVWKWNLAVTIVGLWVNEDWQVEPVE